MKKLSFLLAFLLAVSFAFCSCGKEETASSEEEKSTVSVSGAVPEEISAEEPEESSTDPYEHLRGLDYGECDVTFLVRDDNNGRYKSVEILTHEENPDIINEAIAERNTAVEQLLNCKIKEVRVQNVYSAAIKDINGGGTYDIFMPGMPEASNLATQGYLFDLYTFGDVLKLENSYWDQCANKDFSISNKLYFTVGDSCLLNFNCSHAIVFNKTVAEKCGAEDPYELLKTGKWTYDALIRNAKLADTKDNGSASDRIYGFLLNDTYTITLFVGAGESLTEKDSDDVPHMKPVTDRSASVMSKIREMYHDSSCVQIIENMPKGNDSDIWYAASRAVGEGRALFRSLSLIDLPELDVYDCNYGLLPTPKFNEEQDDYINIVSGTEDICLCIPVTAPDPERAAAVMEAFTIASTPTIRRAYYDVMLKNRRIADEEGEYALDIMLNNRSYEIATLYSFGGLGSLIETCAKSSGDVFASQIEKIRPNAEKAIADLVEKFR